VEGRDPIDGADELNDLLEVAGEEEARSTSRSSSGGGSGRGGGEEPFSTEAQELGGDFSEGLNAAWEGGEGGEGHQREASFLVLTVVGRGHEKRPARAEEAGEEGGGRSACLISAVRSVDDTGE